VKLVYLKGDYDLIKARLSARSNHYMNPALLESQFQTLEEPSDALCVDIQSPPEEIVEHIRTQFRS
jgi:gluconokinase